MEMKLKISQLKRHLNVAMNRYTKLRNEYFKKGSQALENGDTYMAKRFAEGYLRIDNLRKRLQRLSFILDQLELSRTEVGLFKDFATATQGIVKELESVLGSKELADLSTSMMRIINMTEEMEERIELSMETIENALETQVEGEGLNLEKMGILSGKTEESESDIDEKLEEELNKVLDKMREAGKE
ncbi:MAG: hypothetical protein DRP30_02380 [Thermotoga sp.]|nr:MAG: hypothetical protein DRP30_02380 [Thermotoga sp.]